MEFTRETRHLIHIIREPEAVVVPSNERHMFVCFFCFLFFFCLN